MAIDPSIYERQRRNVNETWGNTSANNAYSQFLASQQWDRSRADATQGFKRSFPKFSASFGQRGLSGGGVRSGTMQSAMRRFVGDHNQTMGRMQQDQNQQNQQFTLGQSQLDQWRMGALQDIEADKQAAIAQAALNLKALNPYLGGSY
jgi:hypothetical protein